MNSRNQRLAIIAGVVVLILAIGVIIAGNGGRLGGTGVDTPTPEVANNNPPPTDVPPPPPTDVPPPPPTDVPPPPPTDVPPAPTDVPATAVPPTDVPPTDVPPTDVPATAVGAAATDVPTEQVAVAPTDVPPTDVPPTDVGATEAPTTEGTPEVAVTEAPTAEVTAITVQDATVEATGSGTPGRIGIQAEGNEPVIQISVTCNLDGSANFTITNIGDAMTEAGRLVVNDPLNPANNRDTAITLGAGGSTGLSLSGTASVQVTYNTAVLQNVLASATGECIPTQTPTNTATNLPTSTSTRTSTNTPLPTNTRTITPTPSLTFTPSPTVPTNTPSATNTRRPTNTPSLTYTPSLTLTPSPTVPTNTPSVTNTRAPTNTRTNTPTPSLTFTPSPTVPTNTPSATNTRRPTNTRTNTFTPSPTVPTNTPTQTFTASATLEPSLTYTASATRTPRPTNTVTPTRTLTSTSAPTNTATLTATLPPDAQLSLSVICLSRGENGQARFTISLQTDGTFTNGTYAIDLAGSVTSNGFSKGNLPITLDLAGYAVVRVNYVTPLRPFNQLSATANCSPRPTETPTNTVVPSNTPSRTPVPTDTPTNTPVPTDTPTNTPPPTNTPTNTATPQPDLSYGGQCLNFVSSFTVTNNGGAQSEATNYEVRDANGNVLKSGSFQLAAGASTTIEFSPSYGNIKLFLTSGPTVGEVSSVNCGEPTPTPTSTSTSTPQPDLSYSGQCLNFVSSFTVTNNGGAQSEATNYEVRDANGNVLKSGSFQLAAGASTTIEFSPSYGNIKLFLTSGPTVGEVSSVNCGEPTPTPTSTSTSTPQPDLSYTGQCVEFVSSFTVTNKGGDQSEATNYEVRDANGNVLKSGSFQLAAGASTTIEFSPSYGNIKLFLTSGPTVGEVSSVNCGEPTPTPTSTSTSTPEPSITYEGQCVESVVTFTITNNGGAQSQPMTYAIQDKSGAVVKSGAVTLGATPPDNTATITYGPTNGQVTLFVLEPGKTLTPTKVVDCGEPTPTPTSTPTGTPVSVALAPQGQCKEGVATFIISNTSGSDMPAADTYVIKNQDGVVVQQGSFQLKAGESTTITVAGATGVLTLTAAGTGVTVNTDCSEITTPTATPPVVYRCGETSYYLDGFPIIAPNPEYCQPEENQPISWTPITPGAGFCPDWLLYHTIQTGDWEVFRLGEIPNKPNAKVDITNGVGKDISDVAPARSPDSAWVAFASNRDGNWEIYIVGSDGENLQRMTKNASATDIDPVWSPDGTKVVYESIRSGNWDLYEFDVTNGTERRLTSNPAQDLNAFYSPDGSKLIFQSSRDEQWQIYQLDLNTLQETRLSDGQGTDNDPQVSPDGKHIAFWSTRGTATNSMLYVMDADGKNVQAISSPDGDARNQAYSADGDLIAYQMTINGKLGIYVYQFSTQKTRQVTSDATGDFAPTWYCKSPTIVWTSNADGNNNIYSTNALPMDAAPIDVKTQGSQLTSDPANDQYPQNFPAEENASRKGLLPTINRK